MFAAIPICVEAVVGAALAANCEAQSPYVEAVVGAVVGAALAANHFRVSLSISDILWSRMPPILASIMV